MIPLTERILNDAAGWQVMKMAKALQETRRVVSANYTPPILKGLVREGNTEYRAGLKITSPGNIENLCSCRPSRDFGQICAHSVAVGLATLAPAPAPPPAAAAESDVPKSIPFVVGSFTDPRWIELHLVLGPNFQASLENNALTIGVEASRGTQRGLVKALGFSQPWTCSQRDFDLLTVIYRFSGGSDPGMLICNKQQFGQILKAGKGFDHLSIGRREKMTIHQENVFGDLVVSNLPNNALEVSFSPRQSSYLLLGEGVQWSLNAMTWQQLLPVLPTNYQVLLKQCVKLAPKAAEAFRKAELPALKKLFSTEDVSAPEEAGPVTPEAILVLEGSLNQLQATIQFIYGSTIVNYGSHLKSDDYVKRSVGFEDSFVSRLEDLGFKRPRGTATASLLGEHQILNFLSSGLPQLQNRSTVHLGPRLKVLIGRIQVIKPVMEIRSSGEDWFEMSIEMTGHNGAKYSPSEIQRLLNSGKAYEKQPSGAVALFDTALLAELQTVLRDCDPSQTQSGHYRIDKMHAGFVNATLGDRLSGQVVALKEVKANIPAHLVDVLRPYQVEGVQWMQFLAGNNLGGILADEMGLGKTLQALAFLQASGKRAIVVCPSSLVFNWEREARKFTPDLRVLTVAGSQRDSLFKKMDQADLVITSYALLRRDVARYERIEFSCIILDEANHIKNPDTQNAVAAKRVQAKHKFVLTGTPVENSVRDIWSLSDFIVPGYLGRRDDFKDRYELPIQRGNAADVQKRLSNRLRPIMLRRLKKDVAKDLPARLEQVAWVELTDAQKSVYRELLEQGRKKIEEAGQEKDAGRGQMAALTALLRLRQACCDLRLLGLEDADDTSAKLEMLEELLEEAMDGGHRVLVFSQFVSMLKLISARMEALKIPFAYLDGSTKDRAGEVDKFQNSGDLPLFLISLKAGGVGLNLSAADTVIHFDPWWNPAVEAQATDRAHRIGQTRVVTSYKLIARNTVEEKILHLQQRKRDVIDATIESEEPTFNALTLNEIRDLMS